MGLVTWISKWLEQWVRKLTMDLEGLPRLGFDPFSIDVNYVLLEERRIIQLAEGISKDNRILTQSLGQGERAVCSDLGPLRMF